MHIHLVCRGNLYRSRLAEAYLCSKHIPGLLVTSSGTEADVHKYAIGPISWEALRLIKNNNLVSFMKLLPEQTSEQTLLQADEVIFFGKDNQEVIQARFPHLDLSYQIWEIPDIILTDYRASVNDDARRIEMSERTFNLIKHKIDELVDKTLKQEMIHLP